MSKGKGIFKDNRREVEVEYIEFVQDLLLVGGNFVV